MVSPEIQDPLIGTFVGRYRVESKLGQGGMGAVYELVHPAIHKRMALKLLHEEFAHQKEIVQRFFDEARAVNLIEHPNIVDITDFSHLPDGRPFIVMEYLSGQSFEAYLEEHGALSTDQVVPIAKQLCSALYAAHQKGIVHRDLKPENIFLSKMPDGSLFVKVLDFGIAKLRDLEAREETKTGLVLGTPTYMSPEQASGDTRGTDHRTDIYAVGVMLYQMFAGQPPFSGSTFAELVMKHLQQPAPSLADCRSDLPAAWAAIVDRCLAKNPADRFDSMEELSRAVEDTTVAAPEEATPLPVVATIEPQDETPIPEDFVLPKRGRKLALFGSAFVLVAMVSTLFLLQTKSDGSTSSTTAASAAIDAHGGSLQTDSSVPSTTKPAAVPPISMPDAAPPDARAEKTSDAKTSDARVPRQRKRPRGKGTLVITANPWAIVTLDGKQVGQTPWKRKIPAGSHRVKLQNGTTGQTSVHRFHIKSGGSRQIAEDWK